MKNPKAISLIKVNQILVYLSLLLPLIFVQCIGTGTTSDAGIDDARSDADDDAVDGNDQDENDRGCVIGNGYALSIADGIQICTINTPRTDVFVEYELKTRLTFKPGVYFLDTCLNEFLDNWIDRLEYGPDARFIYPSSDAIVRHTEFQQDGSIQHFYEYEQSFDTGNEALEIRFILEIDSADDTSIDLLSNEAFFRVGNITGILGDGSNLNEDLQWYTDCRFPGYNQIDHYIETSYGDTISLQQLILDPTDPMAKQHPSVLVETTYNSDSIVRDVVDFFHLVYTSSHHNFLQSFLVVFNEPVGNFHGLLLQESEPGQAADEVIYLDENLSEIGRRDIIQYQISKDW